MSRANGRSESYVHRYRWYWKLRPIRGTWGFVLDRALVRYTGYSAVLAQVALARHQRYNPALLLITVGRKSGQLVETVLPYVIHGDSLLVMASNNLMRKDPSWLLNLREHERCWVIVNRGTHQAVARIAGGEERPELVRVIRAHRPHVIEYETAAEAAGRVIPVVVLSRPFLNPGSASSTVSPGPLAR